MESNKFDSRSLVVGISFQNALCSRREERMHTGITITTIGRRGNVAWRFWTGRRENTHKHYSYFFISIGHSIRIDDLTENLRTNPCSAISLTVFYKLREFVLGVVRAFQFLSPACLRLAHKIPSTLGMF